MELKQVVSDIADAMVHIDNTREAWHQFNPGVGPFPEPQLVKRIMKYLNSLPEYKDGAHKPKGHHPDLRILNKWAIEFKIVRTYGDNGKKYPPGRWSMDMIHPYPGNASVIGDCYTLLNMASDQRKAVIAITYGHADPKDDKDLTPLLKSFDEIIKDVVFFSLSPRIEAEGVLDHPYYKKFRLLAWEVLGRAKAATAH
jgi:hypothetical protein